MPGISLQQIYADAGVDVTLPSGLADQEITGFEIDSRQVTAGSVFVALPGANTDGHDFLDKAIANGAQLLIVEREPAAKLDVPVLVVADCLKALGKLANCHRARCKGTIIGITGSVGKTTAKDFLLQLLDASPYFAYAAPKSYNSEIGLPLAMLGAPRHADFIVLEYGINKPHEMQYLLDIVKPDLAALIAIGAAHLEGLDDVQTIAYEKNKLLQAVPESGKVWLDEHCKSLIDIQQQDWAADVQVYDHASYSYTFDGEKYLVEHPLLGALQVACIAEYELRTAMLMTEIAISCKVSKQHIQEVLPQLQKPKGRMQRSCVAGIAFIDDAYNANPLSMLAALRALTELPCTGRRIAVLGSMLELGVREQQLHADMGSSLEGLKIDSVVCIGDLATEIAKSAPSTVETHCVADCQAAAQYLETACKAGDLVLLKASRGEQLENILVDFKKLSCNPIT
ncbi:MAG: UDP-N-acetylmuramoyl-tripeptide--D-alanyl-D-alanine ligase [Myxococcota bacterium]|jgi:UDP-N-acetylmuramoyl-tripeptide--D-alanyl-D-alanine ligase